ncbi:MAG: S8 family serine peptidase [Bryobacterales bacterium]|nr:S8 family serine peptidase [Bryobacterales bacterium]
MTAAAVARIAAESRGALREPSIEAAPRSSGTPAVVDRAVRASRPSPPDGYSFVSHHGQMPKARIEGEIGAGGERPGTDLDWLGSSTSIETLAAHAAAAGRDWSFGWIRLEEAADPNDLERSLQGLGGEIVGSSGNLMRVRLPGDESRLQQIAALPQVDGLGAVPRKSKLAQAFANQEPGGSTEDQMPVFITLMTDDPDGRWRRALEDLGTVVGRFDPDIRVYSANVSRAALEAVAAADFVLAIEPIGIVEASHDTAVPAMGADALRRFDGSPGLFSGIGGASVPIAVMDSGLNINHLDIASNRRSICGANFVWFGPAGPLQESEDLWIDEYGHGTHVTGTIAGNGAVEPRFAGMAPAVRHIRFAKVLHSLGFGNSGSILPGMDFLARPTGCAEAGGPSDRVKPLIVNMSLSASARVFEGRGASERKLDSTVWSYRQLYVVSQANSGISGFSNYGTAKNSLAVGAVLDSGDLAVFSSRGPTFDGRLAPQVVATGVRVHSARGGGSRGEYVASSGTSMSSPAVAGVAALLMDAVPEHREQPALTRARLMASAIRPDAWLEDAAAFPRTNTHGPGALQAQYGLGMVSARTSVLDRDRADGWISGAATAELQDGDYAYHDIVVPEGAGRLDLVMTWDEPPTDTIGSAVLNDLDLWLDRDGDCGSGACGERVSASRVDNVEWIILRNPQPGSYRAKVAARRVYTAAPRAALAWTVIRGASTPSLRIDADKGIVNTGRENQLTVTVTADEYVAAGTRLHVDCRGDGDSSGCTEVRIHSMDVSREDGVSVDLSDELGLPVPLRQGFFRTSPIPLGSSIPLGEISAGETQEIEFVISYNGEANPVRLYFTASAWNAEAATVSFEVRTGGSDRPEVANRPPNDDFAAAALIEGEEGSRALDLLLATPEPGEPLFTPGRGRPAGSVWYEWTAPEDGPARFNIPLRADSRDARNDRLSIFRGDRTWSLFRRDRISSLERVADGLWGATFFAEKGQSYRIRVSSFARGAALNLRWSQGPRPANDDFTQAVVLEGAHGVVEGNSQGATLETGEWFGRVAATAWYRWTAPSDGLWEFESDESRRIFVFESDGIPTLRLVSHYPSSSALFPAAAGKEYHIAVAEMDAYAGGGPYQLRWISLGRAFRPRNDDIADAEAIESAPSSEHVISVDSRSTVESGEPVESGVRTKWWLWEAPEDGYYTWRITGRSEFDLTYAKLLVTVFTGSSIEDLQLAAESGPDAAPSDFVFQAVGGQRYWIAAGFPAGDITAYTLRSASARVIWGPTPGNDHLSSAEPLSGAAGSITGSNRFATVERGERSAGLGHSSLWWTYEALAPGWYRFWIDETDDPWMLAVYEDAGGGFGSLELVSSSSRPEGIASGAIEAVFRAVAGARYTIRLGTRGDPQGGEFTMNWGESEAPVWLKYTGRLTDGGRDATGNSVELRTPLSLVFNGRGTALYAASRLGLQVFERDMQTGGLTLVQSLKDHDLEDSSLIWYAFRSKLYVHQCGTWRKFGPVDGTHRDLQDEGTLTVTGSPEPVGCNSRSGVFIDSGGSFLYMADPFMGKLQVFAFDTPDALRHVQTLTVRNLKHALISNDDSRVYAATRWSLLVYERDAETGRLTQVPQAVNDAGLWNLESIAISSDNRYLFAFDDRGRRTNLFQLEDDPSRPSSLPPFWNAPSYAREWLNQCGFSSARMGSPAVDVFCRNMAFSVRWRPESGELAPTDYVATWQSDRFNNHVPAFGHTQNLLTSPDGRHAYLSTEEKGLLIFERVGAGADEYAPLKMLSVSPGKVSFGSISTDAGGCIGLENAVIGDARYAVVSSKWQTRANSEAEWMDVEGTETVREVCSYTPLVPAQARLVAEIAIDGEIGKYAGNVMTH